MKTVLLIPDGMGDRPLADLGGKTPLEAAATPHMDDLAAHGVVGLSHNIPVGFVPGTDIGCMSVFGYDPRKYFTGRGPLEAAEHGIELKNHELAFRCNLVTVQGEILKDFSADHISLAEAKTLLLDFDEKVRETYGGKIRFYPGDGTGYRNLMVYRDDGRRMQGLVCAPPHDIMGQPYKKYLPQGDHARLLVDLMEKSREFFKSHPVNQKRLWNGKGEASMIWLWGQGFPPVFPSYFERYGFHGGVITAVDLVKGIAIHAGLDVIPVPGITGYFDTNYAGKAEYAINALRSRDFVVIHVESTDEAGHMGDVRLKIKAIEDVDQWIVGTLCRGLTEFGAYRIMVLPDHYTCVETRTHASDAVPFLIYSTEHKKRGSGKFCERTARESGLEVAEGHTLMESFIWDKFF